MTGLFKYPSTKTTLSMKTFLENYFYYSKRERKAALVLIVTCCLLIVGRFSLSAYLPAPSPPDFSAFEAALATIDQKDSLPDPSNKTYSNDTLKANASPTLFPFDPNQASEDDLLRLGISRRVVLTLLNYRSKGGRFFKKEDLQKIYGMPADTYQQLLPYIDLTSVKKKTYPKKAKPKKEIQLDINRATAEEWQQLRGIGPYYAKRILRFREKLGGFSTIEQVADTYHLPDSTFQQIKPFLTHSPVFKKLAINTLTTKELAAHPYLGYKEAQAIVNYREQHGPFLTVEKVEQALAPLQTDWHRLKPYISLASP
jgi:competence protein ComEA